MVPVSGSLCSGRNSGREDECIGWFYSPGPSIRGYRWPIARKPLSSVARTQDEAGRYKCVRRWGRCRCGARIDRVKGIS